ncbi:MAG: hypothetical protein RAK20_05855 [Conexivisphaerales archaeon]|nr:hypothetical protein [Conexivisphaerales archaeon]
MQTVDVVDLYKKGLKVTQISKILNVSTVTVYNLLHAAGMVTNRRKRSSDLKLIADAIELNGFVKVKDVKTGKRLEKLIPGSYLVTMNFGVGSVGRKYSSTEFFGFRPPNMHFLVKDYEMYRYHVSKLLEGLFLEKNRNAPRGLRVAFTRFLRSFGLEIENKSFSN